MTPRSWREKNGITLDHIAKEGGYEGTSYISEVESGKKSPSMRLARVYHRLSGGKVNLLAQ